MKSTAIWSCGAESEFRVISITWLLEGAHFQALYFLTLNLLIAPQACVLMSAMDYVDLC